MDNKIVFVQLSEMGSKILKVKLFNLITSAIISPGLQNCIPFIGQLF